MVDFCILKGHRTSFSVTPYVTLSTDLKLRLDVNLNFSQRTKKIVMLRENVSRTSQKSYERYYIL